MKTYDVSIKGSPDALAQADHQLKHGGITKRAIITTAVEVGKGKPTLFSVVARVEAEDSEKAEQKVKNAIPATQQYELEATEVTGSM